MDPYRVLDIPPTATTEQIRTAYRALARRWHPDRFAEGIERDWANDKMAEINAAYTACLNGPEAVRANTEKNELQELERIEALIDRGECARARQLLMALDTRCAQWNYLLGTLLLKTGDRAKARIYLSVASHQKPECARYARALKASEPLRPERLPLFRRFSK